MRSTLSEYAQILITVVVLGAMAFLLLGGNVYLNLIGKTTEQSNQNKLKTIEYIEKPELDISISTRTVPLGTKIDAYTGIEEETGRTYYILYAYSKNNKEIVNGKSVYKNLNNNIKAYCNNVLMERNVKEKRIVNMNTEGNYILRFAVTDTDGNGRPLEQSSTEKIIRFNVVDFSYGDINNDHVINNNDSTLLKQYVAGSITLDNKAKLAADIDCNGRINNHDVDMLDQYIADNSSVILGPVGP